ncbi:hypothetical protein U9M48_013422 [Paspalum notatum var. saurae]|uniref:Uncharacterized protein n=1 Tax=Paspalum notatum var. saurae TaxID=547442 RepID=A0AAQ3T0G4_PASNO
MAWCPSRVTQWHATPSASPSFSCGRDGRVGLSAAQRSLASLSVGVGKPPAAAAGFVQPGTPRATNAAPMSTVTRGRHAPAPPWHGRPPASLESTPPRCLSSSCSLILPWRFLVSPSPPAQAPPAPRHLLRLRAADRCPACPSSLLEPSPPLLGANPTVNPVLLSCSSTSSMLLLHFIPVCSSSAAPFSSCFLFPSGLQQVTPATLSSTLRNSNDSKIVILMTFAIDVMPSLWHLMGNGMS